MACSSSSSDTGIGYLIRCCLLASCLYFGLARAQAPNKESNEPEFHKSTPTNITAQMGSQVFLPCKVINLGDRSVSWLRRRDQHILAVGDFKYVADDRFRAFYSTATDTWMLQIKYVKQIDAGSYECQIPTTPKKSHRLDINVIVPDVRIIGGPEIYVKSDNRLNLRCRITKCIEPPELVEWYKDSRRISVSSSRLRIVYDKRLSEDGSATSTLEISKAVKSDSGMYSCKPSHLESSNVTVTVVNGENLAAMHHRNNGVVLQISGIIGFIIFLGMFAAHGQFGHDILYVVDGS